MTQYIDKSALVAEIENRLENENILDVAPESSIWGLLQGYKNIKDFINTLEVKEVDLEKEAKECWDYVFALGWDENSFMTMKHDEFMAFAKHFFELGMQVSNKEKKGE